MKHESLFDYGPGFIRTVTGVYINVLDPKPEMINIYDIAHSLSFQARFGGHLPHFYSVAEHSIKCCESVSQSHKLAALLHDASEAYLLDIPRPIKTELSNYKEIEERLMNVIAEKFGFQWPLSKEVKEVDEEMLHYEWNTIMIGKINVGSSSDKAKEMFLSTFQNLTK